VVLSDNMEKIQKYIIAAFAVVIYLWSWHRDAVAEWGATWEVSATATSSASIDLGRSAKQQELWLAFVGGAVSTAL